MTCPDTPYPIYAKLDSKPRLLTREEERRLALRARRGDHRARGELVERNLRLVIKIATGFKTRAPQMELLDLVSEGVLGLMRAIDKFDPDAGYKLSTYATWWITQAITRAVDRDGSVSIPIDIRREVRAADSYATREHPGDASSQRVHQELSPAMRQRIDAIDVDAARAAMNCASIDYSMATSDGQSLPLASMIADPHAADPCEEVAARIDLERDVADAMRQLDHDEASLVRQRFGLAGSEPTPLTEVARRARIDLARARRLERSAFAKMRSAHGRTHSPASIAPAMAVLDMLRHGRREHSPPLAGAAALAAPTASL